MDKLLDRIAECEALVLTLSRDRSRRVNELATADGRPLHMVSRDDYLAHPDIVAFNRRIAEAEAEGKRLRGERMEIWATEINAALDHARAHASDKTRPPCTYRKPGKRGKLQWPPPVYVAHYQDGATQRMSFASPAGKPPDMARGRALCSRYGNIVAGQVESGGKIAEDRLFENVVAMPKAKPARQRKIALDDALAVIAAYFGIDDPTDADLAEIRNRLADAA